MDKATEAPKRGRPRTAAKPKRDPERTRSRILEAATDEFTKHGLGGARVDRIAKRAGTNERMLYYYFISKEQLFLTVLENVYINLAEAEKALELDPATGHDTRVAGLAGVRHRARVRQTGAWPRIARARRGGKAG